MSTVFMFCQSTVIMHRTVGDRIYEGKLCCGYWKEQLRELIGIVVKLVNCKWTDAMKQAGLKVLAYPFVFSF